VPLLILRAALEGGSSKPRVAREMKLSMSEKLRGFRRSH
jgi:hypothetical protein